MHFFNSLNSEVVRFNISKSILMLCTLCGLSLRHKVSTFSSADTRVSQSSIDSKVTYFLNYCLSDKLQVAAIYNKTNIFRTKVPSYMSDRNPNLMYTKCIVLCVNHCHIFKTRSLGQININCHNPDHIILNIKTKTWSVMK